MAAFGVIVGAWVFSSTGWKGVWIVAAVWSILTIIDRLWGYQIGRKLAELTIQLIQ